MTWGMWFWILYVLSLLFGGFGFYRLPIEQRWGGAWPLILWILIGILGWKAFGGPAQ